MEQTEYSLKLRLEKRLKKVEFELEKVRGCSPLSHGWQTSRLAKAQRKWDALANERLSLLSEISIIDNFSDMFSGDTFNTMNYGNRNRKV